jgi:hypothetical protein
VTQERKHREDQEDNEDYHGSLPGKGCHASEAKDSSGQGDGEEHDSKS